MLKEWKTRRRGDRSLFGIRVALTQLMWSCVLILPIIFGDAPQADAESQTKVRISQSEAGASAVPLWVAIKQGLFKKYGMEVEPIYVRNSNIQITGLSVGSFQLANTGGAPSLNAAGAGVNVKIVASFIHRIQFDIVVAPEIKVPADLRGKELGVTNIGGTTWMAAMLGLEHLKMDADRDNVKLRAIGNETILVQALETGLLHAVLVNNFSSRRLEQKGFRVLAKLSGADIPFAGTGMTTLSTYLEQRFDVVESVLKALLEAQAFIANPANRLNVVKSIAERLRSPDVSLAEESYKDAREVLEKKPSPSLDGLRNIHRLMVRLNPQIARIRVENLIDDRIMRRLDKNGFIDSLYDHVKGMSVVK